MKIVVVIPTYNEAGNIGRLIDVLADEFKNLPKHEMHILVVDGNSPDGTADIVKQKMQNFSWVHLLMEPKKQGLGAAYIYAFKHAMTELNADALMEFDADFQHDPSEIKKLINAMDEGYDYVIGSRFTLGGSIPKNWAFHRKLLSIGGNLVSKIVLGIFEVNDFTTGFKLARVKGYVDKLNFDDIQSKGFAYKIDLLFKMKLAGAKIKEVPITFGLRDRGDSKMEQNNALDSLKVVLLLRYNQKKEFFKFCAVGFVGLFVDTGLFNLIAHLGLVPNMAALVSGFFAMFTTFMLNNYWSFKKRSLQSTKQKVSGFLLYIGSSMVPILVRSKLVWFAVSWFGSYFLVYNGAFFVGIVFGLVWNYAVYSKIIWKKNKNL